MVTTDRVHPACRAVIDACARANKSVGRLLALGLDTVFLDQGAREAIGQERRVG